MRLSYCCFSVICFFWVYFCSVFSFSTLILLVGSFTLLACKTVSDITFTVLAETLNTAQSINQAYWGQTLYPGPAWITSSAGERVI